MRSGIESFRYGEKGGKHIGSISKEKISVEAQDVYFDTREAV